MTDDVDAVGPALWEQFQVAGQSAAAQTSDLAALSRFPANMEAWWFAPDGAVRGGYFYEDGQNWRQPYPVPGPDASPTSGIAALSRKDDTMEAWWIDADRLVRGAFWYDDGQGWRAYPDPVEFPFRASPDSGIAAVSRASDHMEIWWVGSDGHMRGAFWLDDGKPWRPYPLPSPVKANLSSGLAAVSRFDKNMEVWWVGENGSVEGAFWYDDGDGWRPYGKQVAPDGSAAAQSHNLTAVSRTQTSMDLLWITPEGAVRWAYWNDGSEWQLHPQKVAEDHGASPDSGIAAISRTPTSLEVFWIAPDGSVQDAYWELGGTWKRRDPVAAKDKASAKGGIAAISRTATTTEIFWVAQDGSVQVAVRGDASLPFSFRLLRPSDLVDLRCEAFGCRLDTGSGAGPTIQYKVVGGDSLFSIAQKYYGDGSLYTLIAAANKLANPDLIRVGDVLIIPPRPTPAGPPETYVVQPGDTLWGIAKQRYGDPNKYRLIAEANHLANPGLIVPGQQLLIPRLNTESAQTRLRAVTNDAHIVVHFGAQNLYEQRYPDGTMASGIAATRAANESRMVFGLPKETVMPFSVPGVLEGLTKLGLRTSPLAVPRGTAADRPSDAKGAPTAPKDDQTAIEAPYRLVVSPDKKYGGFMHSAIAAAAPKDPSRVELWHTRLGVRVFDERGAFLRVDEHDDKLRTVRAVFARDMSGAPAATIVGSLSGEQRQAIVRQTADPTEEDKDHAGQLIEPDPLTVERLYLSTLGAWIDWRGAWDSVRYKPNVTTRIDAYRHIATVGRDQYVRVETPIYLCPFGHRAELVEITERKIFLDGDNPAAYLYYRQFIVLRERTRDYGGVKVTVWPYNGQSMPHDAVNHLPFTSISIDPVVTPDLDPVNSLADPFVPYVKSQPFQWKVTGVDHSGRQVPMSTPLLAVPAGSNAYQKARDMWWEVVRTNHPIPLNGSEVAFATPTHGGDTTSRAQFMEIFAIDESPETCTPWMSRAHITVPALASLNRVAGPTSVGYPQKFVQQGFPQGGKAEIYLTLNDSNVKLDFAGGSDRGGGFVEPTIPVKALSRAHGAVGDTGTSANGIEAGKFDPDLFLGSALPKLFGLLNLTDIVIAGDTLDIAPKLVAGQLGFIDAAEAEYKSMSLALDRVSSILKKDRDGSALAGAKARFTALYGLADTARGNFQAKSVTPLLLALRNAPSTAVGPANDILAVLDQDVKQLLANPYLAPFLRALVERPNHALRAILAAAQSADLGKALLAPVENTTVRYDWFPTIKGWEASAPDDQIFRPNDTTTGLAITVEVRTAKDGKPQSDVSAQLRDFDLQLPPGEAMLMRMKFGRIGFRVATGGKPEVDVQFNGIEFAGVLGFIETLRRLIPFDGFSDPPFVDVDAGSVTAGFDLALPSVAIGVFSLENIALGADCRVPFLGEAVTVGFNFCTKDAPFRLTVLAIGGGGWVGIRLAPKGLVLLEMGLEAGASLSLNLGVASGSVSVMIGVYMRLQEDQGQLTGYFRIRGEVEVLGIASASITLELSLTYFTKQDKLIGRATLRVEIEVAFFSASVEITCERKLAGSRGDPSLRDIYPPDVDGQQQWESYFNKFAIRAGA